jgi:hypothetical protein
MSSETETLALHLVRALYDATDGKPQECDDRRHYFVLGPGSQSHTYDEWSAIESAKGNCERALAWHKEKGLIAQLGCDSIPSCNKMKPTVLACTTTDPAQGAQQFENKIVSEFFTNPPCKGITWAGHQGPTEDAKLSVAEAMLKPHWALGTRLNLGNEKQYWQVIHNKTGTYAEGTDSPSGIVEKLCTLINGPGGAVLN